MPQMVDQIYETRHSNVMRQHTKSPDPIAAARKQQQHQSRFEASADSQSSAMNRLQAKSPFTADPQQQQQQELQLQQQQMSLYSADMMVDNRDNIIRAPTRFDDHKLYGTTAEDRELYQQRLPAATSKYSAQQQQQQHQQQLNRMIMQAGGPGVVYPNTERRTPDTYGRSKPDQLDRFTDYEDIYNLGQQMANMQETSTYRRPMSPPTANNNKYIPNMPDSYIPNHLEVS